MVDSEQNSNDPELPLPPPPPLSLPTTTSFFFKGKPKQVLSKVKRVLSHEEEEEEEEKGKDVLPPLTKVSKVTTATPVIIIEKTRFPSKCTKFPIDDESIPEKIEPNNDKTISTNLHPTFTKDIIDLCSEEGDEIVEISMEEGFKTFPRPLPELQHSPTIISSSLSSLPLPSSTFTTREQQPINDSLLLLQSSTTSSFMDNEPLLVNFHEEFRPLRGKKSGTSVITKYKILPNEPISKVYRTHCREKRINFYSIVLVHNGSRIFTSSTPVSLGVNSGSIKIDAWLETTYKQREAIRKQQRESLLSDAILAVSPSSTPVLPPLQLESDHKEEEEEDDKRDHPIIDGLVKKGWRSSPITIKLRVKSLDNPNNPIEIITERGKPLKMAMTDILTGLSLALSTCVKIIFDGSCLSMERSPLELGLEEEDLLEVHKIR